MQSANFCHKTTNNNNIKFIKKLQKRYVLAARSVIISPSISIYNKYVVLAKSLNKQVISELEFGYLLNKKAKMVAITGTNGKTTTTMLINQMLKTKYKCGAYGNIGEPLTNARSLHYDYLSVEVSSFQLEAIERLKPNISVVLNIDADHLDRHKTLNNYINAKLNLLKNNDENSITILNADDANIMANAKNIKGRVLYFSQTKCLSGVFLENGVIWLNLNNKLSQIAKLNSFNLPNNITDDILAAILVAKLCKVSNKNIIGVLNNFKLAPYRATTKTINGIKIINDSKGTNIHSTLSALYGQQNVILLLGGVDKKLDFSPIFKNAKTIKQIICFGETAKQIAKTAKNCKNLAVLQEKNCKNAVLSALTMAKAGDTILFSPACSSFDEFSSYLERGQFFDNLVNNYFKAKQMA